MTPREALHAALKRGGNADILAAAAYHLAVVDKPGFAEHARSVVGSSAAQWTFGLFVLKEEETNATAAC
jgi:hypothetical protein